MIGITGRKQTLCPLGRCIGIFFFTVPGRTDLIKSGHRYVLRHDGWEWETNKTQCHTLIHWLADSSPPKTTEVQSQLSNRNQAVRSCWALRFLHMLKQRDRQRCGRRDSQSLQSAGVSASTRFDKADQNLCSNRTVFGGLQAIQKGPMTRQQRHCVVFLSCVGGVPGHSSFSGLRPGNEALK